MPDSPLSRHPTPSSPFAGGRFARLVVVLLLAVLLAACAKPRWPAITDSSSGEIMPGRWVWAELLTADVERAKTFYGAVFGWSFESLGSGERSYTLARNAGVPVAGMLFREADAGVGQSARWLGLMSTVDPAKAAASAASAGGRVLVGPKELPGRGEVALLADPEGARFGVLRALGGDPPDLFPDSGDFLWRELWARDGAAMAGFYSGLSGAQSRRVDSDNVPAPEWHLVVGGYPRAGILQEPIEGLPSAWLHYVRVDDLQATLARVAEHGGSVLLHPDGSVRGGAVAIITDPLGAALGLAEWREPVGDGGAK